MPASTQRCEAIICFELPRRKAPSLTRRDLTSRQSDDLAPAGQTRPLAKQPFRRRQAWLSSTAAGLESTSCKAMLDPKPARLGDRGPSQIVRREKDAQHIKALSYNRHITSRAPCIAAITRRQGPNQGQEVSTQPIINHASCHLKSVIPIASKG